MKKLFFILGISMFLSACSWVQPLPGADDVALMEEQAIVTNPNCKKLGQTHTQTLDKLSLLKREEATIKQELIALAKNDAVRMRANTIVATSEMQEGAMSFDIYKCR